MTTNAIKPLGPVPDDLRAERDRLASVADAEMKLREGNFDTIESLRAELAALKRINPEDYPEFVLSQEVTRLRAEIAGLGGELKKAHVITGAILRWLEEHQPDVFRRGLHDCVAAAVTTMHGVKP